MADYRRERQSYVSRAGGDEGGPRLRWEDCVKRDVRKAGEEEDWKNKTKEIGGRKRLSDEASEEEDDRPTSCFSLRRSNMFSISIRACWIILATTQQAHTRHSLENVGQMNPRKTGNARDKMTLHG